MGFTVLPSNEYICVNLSCYFVKERFCEAMVLILSRSCCGRRGKRRIVCMHESTWYCSFGRGRSESCLPQGPGSHWDFSQPSRSSLPPLLLSVLRTFISGMSEILAIKGNGGRGRLPRSPHLKWSTSFPPASRDASSQGYVHMRRKCQICQI